MKNRLGVYGHRLRVIVYVLACKSFFVRSCGLACIKEEPESSPQLSGIIIKVTCVFVIVKKYKGQALRR